MHLRIMSLIRYFSTTNTWIRVLVVFSIVWGLLVFMFASKLNAPGSTASDAVVEQTLQRLNQAIEFLEQTKQHNSELRTLIDQFLSDQSLQPDLRQKLIDDIQAQLDISTASRYHSTIDGDSACDEPSLEYEQLRRRVYTNTQEMWRFVQHEVQQMRLSVGRSLQADANRKTDAQQLDKQFADMLELASGHKSALLNDMNRLREVDGYENWRHQEAVALSDLVQRRLRALQNPENCDTAQKLVCRLNKGCGYGCQLHHVVYCFIMAYATERTLILKSKGWRYHKGGWDEVFEPLSSTCQSSDGQSHASWSSLHQNTQVVDLPIIDSLNPRTAHLPLAIPEDLAPRIKRLHGDPIVWWVGQFLKYLLRAQPATQEMLDAGRSKLGFHGPIVGVHVRRTDKVGTEASLHTVDEYMRGVAEYYEQLEQVEHVAKRRVFLASDDPKVIEEARRKYPSYEIIGDPDVARMAAVSTRYTDTSRNGIILDIHLLSLCDHLVCTFSSQVCRVAYEIMQAGSTPDASNRFRSLDDIYYYGGQNAHHRRAVLSHTARNHDEISMQVGDLVGVAGNHWNGMSKGKNSRTNQIGLFPSYKVVDKVETADFPRYPNVK